MITFFLAANCNLNRKKGYFSRIIHQLYAYYSRSLKDIKNHGELESINTQCSTLILEHKTLNLRPDIHLSS